MRTEVKPFFDTFDDKFEEAIQDLLDQDITAGDIQAYFGNSYLGIYIMERLRKQQEDS